MDTPACHQESDLMKKGPVLPRLHGTEQRRGAVRSRWTQVPLPNGYDRSGELGASPIRDLFAGSDQSFGQDISKALSVSNGVKPRFQKFPGPNLGKRKTRFLLREASGLITGIKPIDDVTHF